MPKKKTIKTYVETQKTEFPYMELLSDNSPQISADYYEDAAILNKQVNNPNVSNIAVMAKYGAGKSSVINTYLSIYRSKDIKKKHSESPDSENADCNYGNEKVKLGKPIKNNYARISLSTFNQTQYDEIAVERSILQQLLYSRKKSKLPNSNIERTNKSAWWKTILFSVLLTLFVLALTLTSIEFSLYTREIETSGVTTLFNGYPRIKYVLLAVTFGLFFVIACWIFHYRKLKKIKYKDLEADLVHECEKGANVQITNLINKFIDEVLYFFECVNIDLVVFEDLDRLPTTEIFVKLRELNTIINSSNKCAKKVTFLYAVKDDLFTTDEERAKFFEFILPVVPIINPVTTVSEIEKKLKRLISQNPKMQLSSKLIKGMALYIPDMRILKNTFNDYIFMYRKIFEGENANRFLNADKLFALCVYKNLFPNDYTLLEKREGFIPKIINLKALHNRLAKSIDDEIKKTEREIQDLKSERLKSFNELKTMLNGQLIQLRPINRGVQPTNVMNINTFEGLDFTTLMHPVNTNHCAGMDKEILTPNGERYIDREKRINNIEKDGISKLQSKLVQLKKQKQQISFWSLKEIIETKGIDFCFEDQIKEAPVALKQDAFSAVAEDFLRFLMVKDLIDEHYIEYTSNYKAEKLSQADTKIVQSIQCRQHQFNVQVQNLNEVIKWLDEDDFKQVSVLIKPILSNIDVVARLSSSDNDNKYKNLLNLLSIEDNEKVSETLMEFLCSSDIDECDQLLKQLLPIRPVLCEEAIESNILNLTIKDFIVSEFIKYVGDYDKVSSTIISQYVGTKKNYLEIFNAVEDDAKVIKFIKEQGVTFISLSDEQLDGKIQQHIITNNLYDLSVENLSVVLTGERSTQNAAFFSRNYDTALNSDKQYIISYVNDNLDIYVEEVLLNEQVTCENEPINLVSDLLTTEAIDIEVRKALIKKVRVKFSDISVFETGLYQTLFDCDRVEPTWKNVQFAFEQTGFDTIKNYLNQVPKISGDFVKLDGINTNTPVNLINAILISFTKDEIVRISQTMPVSIVLSAVKMGEVGDEKLAEFIKAERVTYQNTDLSLLINFPQSLNAYLYVYKNNVMGEFDTFFAEAMPIIDKQNRLVYENGYSRTKVYTEYKEKPNSQRIIATVLSCKDADEKIKTILIEKCVEIIKITGYENTYGNYIIQENQGVPARVLWQFSQTALSFSDKLKILDICNYGGDNPDTKEIKRYLISMCEPFNTLYNANKKVRINKSNAIYKLLDALSKRKLIKAFGKVRNKEEYWIS